MAIKRRTTSAIWLGVIFFMFFSQVLPVHTQGVPSDIRIGPYVDKVVLKMVYDPFREFLSLLSGDIDIYGEFVLPRHLPAIEGDPDISVYRALRNGYGLIDINCGKYPLNISGFRRAFAYAYDKTGLRIDAFEGESQEHDSLVPYVNDYCIEDLLPYHYYNARPDIGNQILDDLGFDIDPMTGFRTAPDRSPFNVVIKYGSQSQEVAGTAARFGVDALHSLHIDAEVDGTDMISFFSRLDYHQDYDMAMYAVNFFFGDVFWLTSYHSQNVDVPFRNEFNFANTTYDSWCDVLYSCMTSSEAYDAAAAMQLILHENVPRLVVYQNYYNQPYRNDVFTGHVGDAGHYLVSQWTFRNIRKIDGSAGGTVKVSWERSVYSFNPFVGSNWIMDEFMWPSLFSVGPDLNLLPNLAETVLMETHADNPKVFEGNTRFTVDIIKNATWTDGTPITAHDVANTFTYLYRSGLYGNPDAATIFGELVAAYTPTTYRAIVEFNSESMWHFFRFATLGVFPMHIFNDVDGIGYDGWNVWNPGINPEHPFDTCGPFTLTDFEAGDFYEFSANPDFYYYPQNITPSNGPESPTPPPFNTSLAIAAGAVGAVSTILVGGFFLFKREVV